MCCSLGIKLSKIHRILKFKQSDWLKKHSNFNTDKRKNVVNSFEKDFFKLMNNSVFGKKTGNLRKRISVKLTNNSKDYVRCVSKPNLISQKSFSKNVGAIHQIKPVLILNKPIYVGFSILDLSKLLMDKFHHKFSARLLFTDTGSLVYEIEKVDVYEDFYQDKSLLDFSEYSSNLKSFDPVNKKVIDKMKDEFKGKIISSFVGLE